MEEIWKDIQGYEGLYQISNYGRIKNKKNEYKTPPTMSNGYKKVCLYKNGVYKNYLVHRLVWITFNGEIPKNIQVNHIDEDKTNNCLWNLNLMTPKQNINYGTGIKRRIEKQCKSVVAIKDNHIIHYFESIQEANRQGYMGAKICGCANNKIGFKTHKGFIWKFTDDYLAEWWEQEYMN